MAEETQSVQNKGLLIIAIILAVVVAVVYNLHIGQVKKAQQGKVRRVCQYTRAIARGQTIEEGDLEPVNMPITNAKAFGSVVSYSKRDTIIGKELTQAVRAGQLAMLGHTFTGLSASADQMISPGKVAVAVAIESSTSPGPMLSSGGRVNLVGRFTLGNNPERTYMIMENVRVLSVAGGEPDPGGLAMSGGRRPAKSYRQIMIEVSSDEHRRLLNVLSHIRGAVAIEVLNRDDAPPDTGGVVDDSLASLADPSSGGGGRSH